VRTTTLAALVLAAIALLLAGPVEGAGDSPARTAARAWHGVFGDRPKPAPEPRQRVLVVLSSASLADRMAAAEHEPTARRQRRWTAEAEAAQRLLLAGLSDRHVWVVPKQVFTRTFNGFSTVVTPRALAELERAHDVAGVYPVRTVYPAAPTAATVAGRGFEPDGGRGTQIFLPGFSGDGVKIALLDTGVDRRHAYLNGRVKRGFDVIDDDRRAVPEAKPGEPTVVEAHGTRMAGLVVGHDGPSGLQGVAPDARLVPIRVLGWQKTADGDWAVLGRGDILLAGLERAVDPDGDGDVQDAAAIALVGGVEPYAAFADSPEARATAGATRLGTLVVAPVGNDGRPGPGFGTVAAPAAAAEALAVGTIDARREVLEADAVLRAGDETVLDEPVRVLGGVRPASALRLEVAAVTGPTLAQPDRAASTPAMGDVLGDFFGTNGVSLVAGKAAMVVAGEGAVEQRVRHAAEAGAAAVLVAGTNLPAASLDVQDGVAVPVVAIPSDAGQAILAGGGTLDLSAGRAVPNAALMDVAPFSSGGVAFDGRVKPDLVAPGVGLVTSDAEGEGFATVTGSSAAAAVVAGAAALVAEARPTLSAADLKSALVGSGGRLLRQNLALPITGQGGGLVDAMHAASAEIAVEPSTLAFGRADRAKWNTTRSITVRNVSSRSLTLSFGLVPDSGTADLTFSADPARLTLEPGGARDVSIGVSSEGEEPPAGAGGVIMVSADGAQPVRVPWAIARREAGRAPLVGDVQLSHQEFSPSDRAPVVLAFRAGRVDPALDGEMIEPVGVLELELWTASGRRLGVLARLRDVLPGRYAFGLTGRGPSGKVLSEGAYVIRLRAHPVDGDDGTQPSTAEAVFTIQR
jgi:minor extracellular serine protease Vpr